MTSVNKKELFVTNELVGVFYAEIWKQCCKLLYFDNGISMVQHTARRSTMNKRGFNINFT
jgi:hypothetical protein